MFENKTGQWRPIKPPVKHKVAVKFDALTKKRFMRLTVYLKTHRLHYALPSWRFGELNHG